MATSRITNTRITGLKRLKHSVNGNPRWSVTLETGQTYPTVPDAMCSYGIENRPLRGRVDVVLNGRNMIEYVEPTAEVKALRQWAMRCADKINGVYPVRAAHLGNLAEFRSMYPGSSARTWESAYGYVLARLKDDPPQ